MDARDTIVLGRVSGLHGVRGWVKVYSHTEPRAGILAYTPWILQREDGERRFEVESGHAAARTLRVKLAGIDDRDAAAVWVGATIGVERDRLPAVEAGEYYWADLIGLEVETTEGLSLGRVERLFETGANDVLVVSGERLRMIPWLPGHVIESVDLDGRRIRVNWDPEF